MKRLKEAASLKAQQAVEKEANLKFKLTRKLANKRKRIENARIRKEKAAQRIKERKEKKKSSLRIVRRRSRVV